MSLRFKFVLFFVMLHIFAAVSTYFYEFIFLKQKFIDESVASTYHSRESQYRNFIDEEKIRLNTLAAELSSHRSVIEAYRTGERDRIIEQFESFWKHMSRSGLINEIHFFKKPSISFVNFANVAAYNLDASKVRGDIGWVTSTFQPSSHFLVCRRYPGLRATYPVIIDDRMLGGVSLGIDMAKLSTSMRKLFNAEILYVLKEEELRRNLNEEAYQSVRSEGLLKTVYRFFGDGEAIDEKLLDDQVLYIDGVCYSIFPIHDFHENVIGYFIFKDDFTDRIAFFEEQAWNTFYYYTTVGLIVFIIIMLLVNRITRTMENLRNILKAIRNKDYDALALMKINGDPKHCDEICRFKQQLVETGFEIQNYLELLTKELHDYADKMHMDALTKIFNRHAIDDIGENIFLKAKLAKQPLGVMMLDIDNFKPLNDTYGHDFGDYVLIHVCNIIRETLRSDDFFARYGGEEFVIVLPKTDIGSAFDVGKKICRQIESHRAKMGDKAVSVTISIGLTEVHEEDTTLYDLINRADKKLYQAKRNGKNRVEV